MAIEDSVMYDMSTWSAPLAYNLTAYSTEEVIRVDQSILDQAPDHIGKVNRPDASYAFAMDWNQRHAPKALSMLWQKGYRVRMAEEAFSDGERTFTAGSIIILKGRNLEKKEQLKADLAAIAKEAKVVFEGFDTGRMIEGIDLTSRKSKPIKQPKAGMLVESPFNTYTCGQIYFLFDWETQFPLERLRTSITQPTEMPNFRVRYGGVDYRKYDVLVLPGGGNGLKEVFGKNMKSSKSLQTLATWVQDGGVLIATENAVPYFTKSKSGFTPVELQELGKDTSDAAAYLKYADREDYRGLKNIPGAALNAKIDTSNPLAFGLDDELYSIKFGAQALMPMPGLQTVGHYEKDISEILASGYAATEGLEVLAGNTFAAVLPMGKGKVVFLLDNTQYRMFWRGPSRMMQNAVLLLGGLGN